MTDSKVLVVIDVQREYVTPGRPFHIKSIGPSLENAKNMLTHARGEGWPIVHVRHLQDGEIFNRESEFSDFVEGFAPQAGELEISKGNYSCFSSPEFDQFVRNHVGKEFVVVGYGTNMCCMATIVEGYHRGLKFALVQDACAALGKGEFSEEAVHKHEVMTLGRFSRVTSANVEIGNQAA